MLRRGAARKPGYNGSGMNSNTYQSLLRELGFDAVERGKKLRHPHDPPTLYFNRKRDGTVFFTALRRDQQRFVPELWRPIAPQQKKDRTATRLTLVPVAGKEREALQALITSDPAEPTKDARTLQAELERKRLRQRSDIDAGMRATLLQAGAGQGAFRENVQTLETACRVTGVLDRRHLRATHIKPWSESNDHEKLDGNNGLLLAPHVEHLFERGHISFTDSGSLLVAARMNDAVLSAWGLRRGQQVGPFSPEQCHYLAYHRERIFEREAGGRRVVGDS